MSKSVSRDDLLEYIHDLANDLGETPTLSDVDDDGTFKRHVFYEVFDSWNDALREAGFETNHEYVPDDDLLQSLRDAADELGREPLFEEISEITGHSGTTYARRFGSWLEAREAAGLSGTQQSYGRRADSADLLADLERLGDLFGRAPTQIEIREFGKHSHLSYYRHFDDLPTALESAGFELDETDRDWPDDYPNDWIDRAEDVRERDGYECVVPDCEMTNDEHNAEFGFDLHVHHVATDDGDPDALENLVTLCLPCHKKWDRVAADPRDCE